MDLKPGIRAGLTAHFVDHYDDVYRLAFADTGAPMPAGSRGSEIRTVVTPLEEAMAIPPYVPPSRQPVSPVAAVHEDSASEAAVSRS